MQNRRKGPDWVVKSFHWLSLLGWVVLVIALGLSHLAKPEMRTGLTDYWQIELRQYWEPALTGQLVYLLWACCVTSLCSLLLNQLRLRRAGDRRRYNTLLLLLVALAALSFFYSLPSGAW